MKTSSAAIFSGTALVLGAEHFDKPQLGILGVAMILVAGLCAILKWAEL